MSREDSSYANRKMGNGAQRIHRRWTLAAVGVVAMVGCWLLPARMAREVCCSLYVFL